MIDISEKIQTEIRNKFSDNKSIVIISHHNPDGDAVGSALGLYHVLKNTHKKLSVILPNQASEFLKWMPGYKDIIIFKEHTSLAEELIANAGIIVCVDFNEFGRVDAAQNSLESSKAYKIVIDHHPGPDTRFDLIFSYTEASSASELVYNFIQILNLISSVDDDAACCLFTGIMTDTINFSVNSSRKDTFDIVSKLLLFNINKEEIYDKVFNNFSYDRLRLVGFLLYKKLSLLKEFGLAYIILTQEEKNLFHFVEGDQEGIVNMPLSISGINTSIIAIEKEDHIKISSRSKNEIDLNLLSRKYFNGGGHINAAGGTLYMPINEVEEYIIKSVKEFVSKNV